LPGADQLEGAWTRSRTLADEQRDQLIQLFEEEIEELMKRLKFAFKM
jgi:hypothetical protein